MEKTETFEAYLHARNKEIVYYCPECGAELAQGDYYYDYNSGMLLTECCPECGNMGSPVLDEEQADEKFSC